MTTNRRCTSKVFDKPRLLGPLVDSGAPYSVIGSVELAVPSCELLPNWNGVLDPLPPSLSECAFWQYGSGEHASPPTRILGSISISCLSECGTTVLIRYLVLDESRQWVIGQNVTCNGTICQLDTPSLTVRRNNNDMVKFNLMLINRLLHVP